MQASFFSLGIPGHVATAAGGYHATILFEGEHAVNAVLAAIIGKEKFAVFHSIATGRAHLKRGVPILHFDDATFGRKWLGKVDADVIHGDMLAIHQNAGEHHAVEDELCPIPADFHILQAHQRQGYRMRRLLVVVGDIELHGQGTAAVEMVFTGGKVDAARALGSCIINQQPHRSAAVLASRLYPVVGCIQFNGHDLHNGQRHSGNYGACHTKGGYT
ncbi:MAG: hypothetical protein IKA23_02170 [Akkermansia sp.]|nr:hypothetical protein [Akkermansia sp.]